MSTRLRDALMQDFAALRFEPTQKRIRATVGSRTVVDSTRAMLVWEPSRIVPTYAVPIEDVSGELSTAPGTEDAVPADLAAIAAPRLGDHPVLDPSIPFSVHTADGEPLRLRVGGTDLGAAAFRPIDATLGDHVLLDFAAFDAWYEEDERNVGHPRDPFHRIDIVRSSRHVRIERDGETLADSTAPYLLFEPPLPVRFYLARDHVRTDLLEPSDTSTFCAYKGRAAYLSLGGDDVAWTYPEPLREAAEVTDRIAFFNERVDIVLDGTLLERPLTPWARRG